MTFIQVEEGSRKLDLQWEAHTARLKRAVRGPVVQEGERLAEALLTNHQVFLRVLIMNLNMIMIMTTMII